MSQASPHPVVHMKCKRGSDKLTSGQSCRGMMAEKLAPDGSQTPQFKCTSCGFVWSVPIGGQSPI
jgi:hypothetical protein